MLFTVHATSSGFYLLASACLTVAEQGLRATCLLNSASYHYKNINRWIHMLKLEKRWMSGLESDRLGSGPKRSSAKRRGAEQVIHTTRPSRAPATVKGVSPGVTGPAKASCKRSGPAQAGMLITRLVMVAALDRHRDDRWATSMAEYLHSALARVGLGERLLRAPLLAPAAGATGPKLVCGETNWIPNRKKFAVLRKFSAGLSLLNMQPWRRRVPSSVI